MKSQQMDLAVPPGWKYEDSLSAETRFVRNEDVDARLKFLRHEDGLDVYEDLETGKELFVGGKSH